ncbi:MAG: hypothetical protein JSS41_11450, partial [Proteobacteria bacterium]|nr:hypothetical protein [Pseudomonadota bacterium]
MKSITKRKLGAIPLWVLSTIAIAAGGITINAGSAPYSKNDNISQVNQTSDFWTVEEGANAALVIYDGLHGTLPGTNPVGQQVTITWADGSTTTATVTGSDTEVGLVPNQQHPTPPSKSTTTGGSGGGGGGDGGS